MGLIGTVHLKHVPKQEQCLILIWHVEWINEVSTFAWGHTHKEGKTWDPNSSNYFQTRSSWNKLCRSLSLWEGWGKFTVQGVICFQTTLRLKGISGPFQHPSAATLGFLSTVPKVPLSKSGLSGATAEAEFTPLSSLHVKSEWQHENQQAWMRATGCEVPRREVRTR